MGADPGIGGATPTIVPLSLLGIGAGAGAGAGAAAGGGSAGFGTFTCGACCMSIVPLNLGAAAPFRLKLHLLQV
jgi:hypothetical protein